MSELFQLPENFLSTVSQMYNRTQESLNEAVEQLKSWMKTQPHLPELLDDKSLQNFLILNKCSIERAKQSVDMYYTLRSRIPDIYEDINPKNKIMEDIFNIVYFVSLPKLTKEMYRVAYFKIRIKEKAEKIMPEYVMGLALNLLEVRLKEDVIFGDIVIYDLENVPFGYYAKLTPATISKIYLIFKKIFSIPMKKVFIINSSPHLNSILMLVKTMVKPKIFDRLRVCENVSLLHESLEKEFIPKEYGGDGPSLEELLGCIDASATNVRKIKQIVKSSFVELLKAKMDQYQERFDDLDKLRVDESLRPEKLKNDDVLGFHGNFKKLSVD